MDFFYKPFENQIFWSKNKVIVHPLLPKFVLVPIPQILMYISNGMYWVFIWNLWSAYTILQFQLETIKTWFSCELVFVKGQAWFGCTCTYYFYQFQYNIVDTWKGKYKLLPRVVFFSLFQQCGKYKLFHKLVLVLS